MQQQQGGKTSCSMVGRFVVASETPREPIPSPCGCIQAGSLSTRALPETPRGGHVWRLALWRSPICSLSLPIETFGVDWHRRRHWQRDRGVGRTILQTGVVQESVFVTL